MQRVLGRSWDNLLNIKIMIRKIKSIGYIHDLLHFDCGYTDDEIDEIVESSPGIFNCTNSEIMDIASNVIKR